ncbi:MAG TPA: SRPBCC domain-containing protein [Gaiellaceae bacterium]|nr:SRPBCC domain-containing protein [Gaiellaceae bacterium]
MPAAEPFTASVHIDARPERVFEYFTRAEAMVRWMGDYAVLDARPGGEFTVDINGVPVRGRYLEIEPPHRLVISWGHAGSEELPPGASTLEVKLSAEGGGTTIEIVHRGLPEPEARQHAVGWAHFLDRLAVAGAGGDPGPDPWARSGSPADTRT